MSNFIKGKYRSDTIRLQKWDYNWNASYFITICTENRAHFFGEIINKKIHLSEVGQIAQQIWLEIPKQFDYVKLEAFIVMPNHIHGIVHVSKTNEHYKIDNQNVITQFQGGITKGKNPMLHQNLSRIMRWYKGRVTYEARKINTNFGWQSRFYENRIRNSVSHDNITRYIIKNPELWKEDRFNETPKL
jgi:REP element-mobilizing transposase RayT